MKIQWNCLCALWAVVPSGVEGAPEAKREQGHAALLGILPHLPQWKTLHTPDKEPPQIGALKGHGGGMAKYEEARDGKAGVYRPWRFRHELHPYDLNSPDFLKPENRLGYRKFYAANPGLSLHPNSRDRHAETNTQLMFGLTALLTIVGGIFIIHGLQVLDTENLSADDYQKTMTRVIACAAVPWLVLGLWLLAVFAGGVFNPMRDPAMEYHWQCSAMAWYLPIASVINVAFFSVHALWAGRLFFNLEGRSSAPMGRMFLNSKDKGEKIDVLAGKVHSLSGFRHPLLALEIACAVFGYMLLSFRYGSNSQFCQPEVYWATFALVITDAVIVVFSALAICCSLVVGAGSNSLWFQDFTGSFTDNRLLTRAAKYEEKDKRETAEWKATQQSLKAEVVQERADLAEHIHQHYAEEREYHDAIMEEHAQYQEAVAEALPKRYAVEEVDPSALAAMQDDGRSDGPLVIWGDDESVAPGPETMQTMQPSMGPSTMAGNAYSNMNSVNAPTIAASSMAGFDPFNAPTQPVDNFSGSMVALNAQIDTHPKQPWTSFAAPFGQVQRPDTPPMMPAAQERVMPGNGV